jgi:predicted RNase H-like nuclease (RuvC/YqgF family)
MSPPDTTGQQSEELEFEQTLAEVERSLQELKDRHAQIQNDQQRRIELQARQEQLKRQLRHAPSPALKTELQQIQDQLDELEVALESRLFSLSTLKEPFWQIVRFGGLGLILGWSLAFAVLQNPQPKPQPTATVQSR